MSRAAPEQQIYEDEFEDGSFPVVLSCAQCGLATCEGCAPKLVDEGFTSTFIWQEQEKKSLKSLYQTALQTAENPTAVFADSGTRSLSRAISFGVLVEFIAVSSTVVFYCSLAFAFSTVFRRFVEAMPYFWPLFIASLFIFSSALLAVHLIWVFSQEYGIKRAGGQPDFREAAIFGLYACGWDLLTSPAGLLLASIYRGIFSGFPLIRAASRAPKVANKAHLEQRRTLTKEEQRSVFFWSLLITGSAVFFGAFLLFITLLTLMFFFLMAI